MSLYLIHFLVSHKATLESTLQRLLLIVSTALALKRRYVVGSICGSFGFNGLTPCLVSHNHDGQCQQLRLCCRSYARTYSELSWKGITFTLLSPHCKPHCKGAFNLPCMCPINLIISGFPFLFLPTTKAQTTSQGNKTRPQTQFELKRQ